MINVKKKKNKNKKSTKQNRKKRNWKIIIKKIKKNEETKIRKLQNLTMKYGICFLLFCSSENNFRDHITLP